MARAKKDFEKEIAEVVKKLPAKRKAQVLNFAKQMFEIETRKKQKKLGPGATFLNRLFTEGLYDGDGVPYDIDEVIYEDTP